MELLPEDLKEPEDADPAEQPPSQPHQEEPNHANPL